MKLIIDIPEEVKEVFDNATKDDIYGNFYDFNSIIGNAIKNGVPLPKEHCGKLMILSKDKLKENLIDLSFSCQKWISEVDLSNAIVAIIKESKD